MRVHVECGYRCGSFCCHVVSDMEQSYAVHCYMYSCKAIFHVICDIYMQSIQISNATTSFLLLRLLFLCDSMIHILHINDMEKLIKSREPHAFSSSE